MKTPTRIVPHGGYGKADGTILTRAEVTKAVAAYARRNNLYARTVRAVTIYFRAAMEEYRK